MKKFAFVLTTALMLCGCISTPPTSELFEEKQIETSNLSMAVWEKKGIQKGQPLRIYFEGDGNPNPKHMIAFDFAKRDKSPNVVYVARPCQWIEDKICERTPEIYKESRFHPEIMKEIKELVSYIALKYQAPNIELVGYDGGAVIALNMATKIPTSRVITIAGITDIDSYNDLHDLPKIDPEKQENPNSYLPILAKIPQIHYVGKEDNVTPRRLVERFVARMNNPKSAVVKLVPGVDHIDWEGVELDYE